MSITALQVSALLGQMGGNGRTNVFGVIAEAAIHPERFLPDTPTKKVRLAGQRAACLSSSNHI